MVGAQLAERSLSTPEICGSIPVFGKNFIEHLFTVNCIEKTKIAAAFNINGTNSIRKTYFIELPPTTEVGSGTTKTPITSTSEVRRA